MPDQPETFDDLRLSRWPRRRNELLRAWDGADRYLLKTLDEERAGPATLVLNDQCGALWLAASRRGPAWSGGDSWLARRAALANAADNGLKLDEDRWLWPGDWPTRSPDQVLIRVPKELSLLEAQLAGLATRLSAGTPLWLAGMDKHLPARLLPVMRHWLGDGVAGLGWKKARRFFARAPGRLRAPPPAPARVAVAERGWQLEAGPGVFGRQHLDIGARFLLAHPPAGISGEVADLGCGNGVLGLALAADNPGARVTFCDESFLAVASARANAMALFGADHPHRFFLGDGLHGIERDFDLILLNPPFHRGHAIDERVARELFRQARRRLSPGGELRVVANRHLDYGAALGRLFGGVDRLAENAKFRIYRCRRSDACEGV